MQTEPTQHRRVLAWTALAVAVLALRLPLLLRPGLGRDEATYVVWSHHPEPAYAPLMQLLVAAGHALPLLLEARWVPFVAGVVVLVLFERLLRARGVDFTGRWIGVALVATCPWQTYAGATLHPDDLQLAVVLAFVLGVRSRPGWALVVAGLGPWAKPSGLLVVVVALVWILVDRRRRHAHRLAAIVMLALAAPPLLMLDAPLVRGLFDFARVEPAARFGMFVLTTLVLAGPALPVLGLRGAVRARRDDPVTWLGFAFVLAFGAAAVVNGQVKGNWMLPAVLLLWPTDLHWTRARAVLALVPTVALSATVVAGFTFVEAARHLETRWKGAPDYAAIAGTREETVASSTRWWHRLAEYRPLDAVCDATTALHDAHVVLSDDYGLAARWAVACPTTVPRLVLPDDPVFAAFDGPLPRGTVVLAVRRDVGALVAGRSWEPVVRLAHPTTGEPIVFARLTDDP